MGNLFKKFQDPESSAAIKDELKSKVGITSNESKDVEKDEITTEETRSDVPLAVDQVDQVTQGTGSEEPTENKATTVKVKEPTKETNRKPIKRKEPQEKPEALPNHERLNLEDISQEELEAFVSIFKKGYKESDKENRMLRLQKKNYKSLIKLKLDKVSISEFVNFAIFYALKSSQYDKIVKLLKQPK